MELPPGSVDALKTPLTPHAQSSPLRWTHSSQAGSMTTVDMRSLSGDARYRRRVEVIQLRQAGCTYDGIALQTGLSRTGVFNICKRHGDSGAGALHDAPNGHHAGDGRLLDPEQEALVRRLIAEHTPEQVALPGLLWTRDGVARLIEQRCGIQLLARTVHLYLARWGYGPQPRLRAADEPSPGAFKRWLEETYPGIVVRARGEGAEIRWGHEGDLRGQEDWPHGAEEGGPAVPARFGASGPAVLSTVTNGGQRHWMDFGLAPNAGDLIGFLRRLTLGRTNKLFLIHGNLRVHEGFALAVWLAEHDESIEVFCLPGHGLAGAPGQPQPTRLAA